MLEVEDALALIRTRVSALEAERLYLSAAHRRVLAETVVSPMNVPPFDNSAVDGYAVRAADTQGANRNKPVVLQVAGEVMAGEMPTQTVTQGTCLRVMTGAVFPDGADAMIMVEDTQPRDHQSLEIFEAARVGQFVRKTGSDIQTGQTVLSVGTLLTAAELGMLASVGCSEVAVHRLPRVAVVTTGDEVLEAGTHAVLPAGKIWNSNREMLAALVAEAGGMLHSLLHLPDDRDATREAFQHLSSHDLGADVIVTAGGVSVGDRDFIKPVLEEMGELALWRVAMKPGKPLAFGRIGKTLFFGLPGNPVSALVTFALFVRPVLRTMAGKTDVDYPHVQAVLAAPVSHEPSRREYVRATTRLINGVWTADPTGAQGSHRLSSMMGANSLLVLPAGSGDAAAGEIVTCLLLDDV
jgi:molybdopterin molybdotransferase